MSYETKILPSGIIIENKPDKYQKCCWFIKDTDILHNEGEPAVEYNNDTKVWYQHDKEHRLDGPAVEYPDGGKFYYIDEIVYRESDYWNHPDVLAYRYLKEHPELEGFV